MTDSIFREIDEDLRREKLEKFWQQNKRTLIVAITVVIVGTAGFTFWQDRRTSTFERATAALAATIQQLKADNQAEIQGKLAEFAATAPAGTATIAQLYAASIAGSSDTAKAQEQMTALSTRSDVAPIYRDLAKLLLVQMRLDTEDANQLQNELSPLKGDGEPWRFSARELSALLSIKQGDTDSARAMLEKLQSDTDAPTGVRERAGRILATLPVATN